MKDLDATVVQPVANDALRLARIARANAESVSDEVAEKLKRFAETLELEVLKIAA